MSTTEASVDKVSYIFSRNRINVIVECLCHISSFSYSASFYLLERTLTSQGSIAPTHCIVSFTKGLVNSFIHLYNGIRITIASVIILIETPKNKRRDYDFHLLNCSACHVLLSKNDKYNKPMSLMEKTP